MSILSTVLVKAANCETKTLKYVYLWGFFTPPVAGADLRAALVASCFLGALPPVDLRAVCLVRAMMSVFALRLLWKLKAAKIWLANFGLYFKAG